MFAHAADSRWQSTPCVPGPLATNVGDGSSTTGNAFPASHFASTARVMSQPSPARTTVCDADVRSTPGPISGSTSAGTYAVAADNPKCQPSPRSRSNRNDPSGCSSADPTSPFGSARWNRNDLGAAADFNTRFVFTPSEPTTNCRSVPVAASGNVTVDPERAGVPNDNPAAENATDPPGTSTDSKPAADRPTVTLRASPSATNGSAADPAPDSAPVNGTQPAPSRPAPVRRKDGAV